MSCSYRLTADGEERRARAVVVNVIRRIKERAIAMMPGDGDIVTGLKNKIQSAAANVTLAGFGESASQNG
jgi:uncharacterized protein (UPF0371 family)